MTLETRSLDFKIQLGQGDYGGSGFNSVEIPQGLWATARINKVGSPAYNDADISIAGLKLELMNQLSRVGLQPAAVRNNIITVSASDGSFGQKTTVFAGVIKEAWPDFSQPAEPVFRINANTGLYNALRTEKPASYTQETDVVQIMTTLANQMGYTLENNGVTGKLSNPYLPGSPRSQALSVADAAGIYVFFEDDNGIMVICPKDGARNTQAPTISPTTGMVGYPEYVGPGLIQVVTLFNPLLRFLGRVQVQNSVIEGANGSWRVISLLHDLSTRPDGPWFSYVRANNLPATSSTS